MQCVVSPEGCSSERFEIVNRQQALKKQYIDAAQLNCINIDVLHHKGTQTTIEMFWHHECCHRNDYFSVSYWFLNHSVVMQSPTNLALCAPPLRPMDPLVCVVFFFFSTPVIDRSVGFGGSLLFFCVTPLRWEAGMLRRKWMGVIKGHLGRQMGQYRWSQQRGFLHQTKPEVVNLNQTMRVSAVM